MRECSWKGSPSRFCSVQTEALRVRRAGDYYLNIQEGACYWPASEVNRPQLLLGQQERRKHHRDQRPQKKKLGHFVLVPANCVRASKLRLGGNSRPAGDTRWGRQCAFGRPSVFGLMFAFGPAKRVWPWPANRVSPAKRVSPAEFGHIFTSKSSSHQQAHLPPANRRPTSKRVPQTPLAAVGGCQRENKQALTAIRRRR